MAKLLFLPHCLREYYVSGIKPIAEEKGYDVYTLPGGSMMKKILEKYSFDEIERIVGVACDDEVGLAMQQFRKIGLHDKVTPINLSKNGCKDTLVSLEEVFSKL